MAAALHTVEAPREALAGVGYLADDSAAPVSFLAGQLGKPVLVPDRGLLGHRVRKNDLGGVYKYEDLKDLQAQALGRQQLRRRDGLPVGAT